ncbi:MAG TPA: NPCBM/NEW2 domain-containing protein, partial [Pirellulales bacterium]|nr:NPCBM/NEW2 domain-containing protein [Pirellulales bacterium]
MSQRSQASASRRAPRINLLRLIDPQRDSIKGAWRLEQGRLLSPEEFAPRLAIPFRLPPEYVLTVVVERLQGDDAFAVGLVAGQFKAAAVVDGWRGAASGLHLLDGQSAENNATTRLGQSLSNEKPNTLIYEVAPSGIRVKCDGEVLINFQGDFNRLSWPAEFGPLVPDRLELVGSPHARLAIDKLELTVISDPDKIAGPIRQPQPPEAPAETSSAKMAPTDDHRTLAGLLNGPEIKPEPPAKKDLSKAERQVRELFGEELAQAKLPDQKKALAQSLQQRALATQNDPAARFVLLTMASEAAVEGGHAAAAMEALEELANWFKVDANTLKLEALTKANRMANSPQLKQEVIKAAGELIDQSIEADAYPVASKAAVVAQSAARPFKDSRLTKEIADKKREIERFAKLYAALGDNLARLEADADDAEANAEVGKFYLLTKQQWSRALPLLARGSDEAYRSLAQRDLQQPTSGAAQKELADGWWELGRLERGAGKTALFKRAGEWYRRALPFLPALEREVAEQRIQAAEAEGGDDAANVMYLADMTEASFSTDTNRLEKGHDDAGNELKVNGQPSPKGLMMQPPREGMARAVYSLDKKAKLFTADVGVNPFPYNAPSSPLTFVLLGDGAVLWTSPLIARPEQVVHCEVGVGKVINLELRVLCPKSNAGAKAVWIEPRLTLK